MMQTRGNWSVLAMPWFHLWLEIAAPCKNAGSASTDSLMAASVDSTYVQVPEDLDSVTVVGDNEAVPERGGLNTRQVNAIWDAVCEFYRAGAHPAISFCLRRHGAILLNRSLGHIRGHGPGDPPDEAPVLARPDTPMCMFSASKAVTAILVHALAEDGDIQLDQRVAHYIPEFAAHGKGQTTVSAVLAHRGGFPMFNLPREELKPELLLDWEHCIELICHAEPTHKRAPRMAYHAVTGGFILAEIIRRVTGEPITAYMDRRIRQPLGMDTFTFGLAAERRPAMARNYLAGMPVRFPISKIVEKALMLPLDEIVDITNSEIFMDAVVPAANIYASAEELSRFYQMLLDGGRWGDQQILAPETVMRAVRPACRLRFDHTLKIPMRYSEGLMLGANPFGIFGPMTGSAFGHIGLMNIYGYADPARDLSVGMLVSGKAILGSHLLALGELLTALAWQCR